MLAKYVSLSTATWAQIQADLIALACGGSIAGLSAGCDKANSAILANSEPAGWTLYDAAGPNSSKVITAKDMANNDKFVALYQPTATSLSIMSFDTYNSSTHTGTNMTGTNSNPLNYSAGNAQTFYVYATARNVVFINNTASALIGSFEFTREAPFMNSNLYPAHALMCYWGYATGLAIPRIKNMSAVGDTLAQYNCAGMYSIGGNSFGSAYRDATDSLVYPSFDVYAVLNATYNNLPLGKLYDVLMSSNNLGNFMDTVVIDGVTYFIIPNAGYGRILIKMG